MSNPSRLLPRAVLLVPFAFLLALSRPAAAQVIRPWTPARPDSMLAMATEARASFRANRGDSVTGPNFHGYEIVGRMALRQFRALGRDHLIQAHAVEAVLDSLGLDTSVALDPGSPSFALLMVHNPFQRSAPAVGFFYWYRGDELLWQGAVYRGGRVPKLRVWWTSRPDQPYHAAVVDQTLGKPLEHRFTLFALEPGGGLWSPLQYEGNGPDLSRARETTFADLNEDGHPELVAWTPTETDSLFQVCADCEPILSEQLWVERGDHFELEDSRLVPSPFSTFVVFINLLRAGNRAGAARLLAKPKMLDSALAQGWAGGRGRGVWSLEYSEPNAPWPRWLAMRFHGGRDKPLYTVRFTQRDMRWVIDSWIRQVPARSGAPAGSPAAPPRTSSKPPPATTPAPRKK